MPVVAPFGEFKLRDTVALAAFLDAHNRRHAVYGPKLNLHGGDLSGPVNGDWMLRHWARHVALAKATKDAPGSTHGLALPGAWQTDRQLADWHALHNRLHSNIDRVLGL